MTKQDKFIKVKSHYERNADELLSTDDFTAIIHDPACLKFTVLSKADCENECLNNAYEYRVEKVITGENNFRLAGSKLVYGLMLKLVDFLKSDERVFDVHKTCLKMIEASVEWHNRRLEETKDFPKLGKKEGKS